MHFYFNLILTIFLGICLFIRWKMPYSGHTMYLIHMIISNLEYNNKLIMVLIIT